MNSTRALMTGQRPKGENDRSVDDSGVSAVEVTEAAASAKFHAVQLNSYYES